MTEILEDKRFHVEHALMMHAYSYVYFPASSIYDEEILKTFAETISNCHIYLVGLMPIVDLVDVRQEGSTLMTTYAKLGESHELSWPLPDGAYLVNDDGFFYLADESGRRFFPSDETALLRLHRELSPGAFHVLYVGQAFGADGSRNAVDRLKKHETLQKIAVQGIPGGYRLNVMLIEIHPDNNMVTVLNPKAKDSETTHQRIASGFDKLFNTTEQERITLYEASLIRYFLPRYNKEFKNSFPSTNMKVLADCYDKDFAAIVSEICFDGMPFQLFSEAVEAKEYHTIKHDLHKDEDRKLFFAGG